MWHFDMLALGIGKHWSSLIRDSNALLNCTACMVTVLLPETSWDGNPKPTLLPWSETW